MNCFHAILCALLVFGPPLAFSQTILRNGRYALELAGSGAVTLRVGGMPPQMIEPEFTVLRSERDPHIFRNFTHPNYPIAPRSAVRWLAASETADALNAWLATPAMKAALSWQAKVIGEGASCVWEYRDRSGKLALSVSARGRGGATRPFAVGEKTVMRATKASMVADAVHWEFPDSNDFALTAELRVAKGDADPELRFTLTPKNAAFYSVAFTGAPSVPRGEMTRAPQECAGRGYAQGDFVFSEADLKLPRVMTVTREGCVALVADPRECRFGLPTLEDSRFGLMLAFEPGDRVKPVLLAPLLGGAESRMTAGAAWSFALRIAARAGDWKKMHRHIARDIHGLRDQRDNSGPGSLNDCLERVMDFLADRNGRNYAMWSAEQKYYDYFTDQTGVFKPFSPLYGLSAAIVTDDEEFFRRRARPAVEFALSRRYNLFAPYEGIYRAIVKAAANDVGGPYVGYAQLAALHEMFQRCTPGLGALAEAKGPARNNIADALAQWRLTGERSALDAALRAAGALLKSGNVAGEQAIFDFLELHEATREPLAVRGAVETAYQKTTDLNLYPAPPDESIVVDKGGVAPVHKHSFGRHKNIWGYPTPQPVPTPEQTVPAWRVSRLGLASPAYPIEYWMNVHGALLRTAALADDGFLADVARNGMVGRFGNYPGDNRSFVSLIGERPDAVEAPPWQWNFATVNPGHAWDFAGAVLDFLVSEAFARSRGAVDFPAQSAAGSGFRVRIYGAAGGEFYGEKSVRLWMPRGLLKSDNRQLDWIAAHGNGRLYLALMNQSPREERATLALNRERVECDDGEARLWRNNALIAPLRVAGNRFEVTVPAKGIVVVALPAKVKLGLQAKLFVQETQPLPADSFKKIEAPFGKVHAMLLRAGRGLTSAFVYAEALPENVVAARLCWRQGDGAWQTLADEIYPYEFSPELKDDAGDFACVFEVEDAQGRLLNSPVITLAMGRGTGAAQGTAVFKRRAKSKRGGGDSKPPLLDGVVSDDFIACLRRAANGKELGLRADGRFYPYSTPQGRRIAWRQPVWDKAFFARGCSREEAEQRLRLDLASTLAELKIALAARKAAVDFAKLDRRQRETLLDFAHSEGVGGLREEFVSAVLAGEWARVVAEHLYVRYAGSAPDHARNKAFAERWNIE